MNRVEILFISVAIFLTMIAWMVIDIYHIQTKDSSHVEIKPVSIPNYNVDTNIFSILKERTP